MKSAWFPRALLRIASFVAPGGAREEWLREWESELWYVPKSRAARFCFGAFADAFWLRRNDVSAAGNPLDSPVRCLAWLAALAVVSCGISLCLPGPHKGPWPAHLRLRDLPAGWFAMLMLTCLLLPATRLAMGAGSQAPARPGRLARGIFLALKIVLVQPILLCGFVLLVLTGRTIPFVPQLATVSVWILTFRWVLMDQRRRCPVCLRLLTQPVGFGNSSHTFLEWYGAESMCSRGHGLLHSAEIAGSSSGEGKWIELDASWRELFSEHR